MRCLVSNYFNPTAFVILHLLRKKQLVSFVFFALELLLSFLLLLLLLLLAMMRLSALGTRRKVYDRLTLLQLLRLQLSEGTGNVQEPRERTATAAAGELLPR